MTARPSISLAHAQRTPTPQTVDRLFLITASVLLMAFFAADHDLWAAASFQSAQSEPGHSLAPINLVTRDLCRRLGFVVFGTLGCALLLTKARRALQQPGLLVWMIASYAALGVLSALSNDSSLVNLAELASLLSFGLGVAGLAKQFTVRELTKLTVVTTAVYLAVGMVAEGILGSFAPQNYAYRFSGTLSPESQGVQCALLALSALALLRHTRRNLPLHLGLIALGMLCLFLTKSRAGYCGFLVAVLAELILQPRSVRGWLHWAWVPAAGLMLLATEALAPPSDNTVGGTIATRRFSDFVIETMAVMDQVSPATWQSVQTWIGRGHGAAHLPQFRGLPQQSSGISELLSTTGVAGIGIAFLIGLVGIREAWREYQRTDEEAYRFLVAQVAFGMVSILFHSAFAVPSLWTATCLAGLVSLAMTAGAGSVSRRTHPIPRAVSASLPFPAAG